MLWSFVRAFVGWPLQCSPPGGRHVIAPACAAASRRSGRGSARSATRDASGAIEKRSIRPLTAVSSWRPNRIRTGVRNTNSATIALPSRAPRPSVVLVSGCGRVLVPQPAVKMGIRISNDHDLQRLSLRKPQLLLGPRDRGCGLVGPIQFRGERCQSREALHHPAEPSNLAGECERCAAASRSLPIP